MGTVILYMDEKTFWRCTPKKLVTLAEVHGRAGIPGQTEQGYIDEIW